MDTPVKKRRRGVVGYMAGKGGHSTWRPTEALEALRAEGAVLRGEVEALLQEAERIEMAFVHVRRALERSQPPMFNRLTVKWWKLRGDGRRVPVLVQVRSDPHGREKPMRVEDRRVRLRRDGGYGLNFDLARRAFDLYWVLWTLRAEVHDDLATLAKLLRRQRRRVGVLDARARDLLDIRAEATARLRDVGVQFEPVVLPEAGLPDGFWDWDVSQEVEDAAGAGFADEEGES